MFEVEKIRFNEGGKGKFVCSVCGFELFEADKKFEATCGFRGFWLHINDHVKLQPLDTYGKHRIQLLCNQCGRHLGHLFNNKFSPTKLRYCVNNSATVFKEV
jgi:peptide-methionine (R)-S-oxide reductase